MDSLLINFDWKTIGSTLLLFISAALLLLFIRPPSESQKVLKFGVGFFILSFFLNIIGSTIITDYFSVLGFTIISIALLRLFWSQTKRK